MPSGDVGVEVVIYYLANSLDHHHEVGLWFKGKYNLELVSASWSSCITLSLVIPQQCLDSNMLPDGRSTSISTADAIHQWLYVAS